MEQELKSQGVADACYANYFFSLYFRAVSNRSILIRFVGEMPMTVTVNTIGNTTTDPALTKNLSTIILMLQPLTKLKLWKQPLNPTVQPRIIQN